MDHSPEPLATQTRVLSRIAHLRTRMKMPTPDLALSPQDTGASTFNEYHTSPPDPDYRLAWLTWEESGEVPGWETIVVSTRRKGCIHDESA